MKNYHLIKRENVPVKTKILYYVASIVAALTLGALILLTFGVNPLSYYGKMVTIGLPGSRFPQTQVKNFIDMLVPLIITSVALSIAYKMRFWNVGGEGQFLIGAMAAAYIPLRFGVVGAPALTILLMIAAAMVAAGLWGAIVAVLKVKFNTNETLLTLMLNYVALYIVAFFGDTKASWNVFLRADTERPKFANIRDVAGLIPAVQGDDLTKIAIPAIKIGKYSISWALIFALLIGVLTYIYLKKTKHGYEIAVLGDSMGTAKYAGMKTGKIIIRTMFLSSALVGLAGFFKFMSAGSLSSTFTDSVGWTGVVVAWLAKLDTVGIVITSILICVLRFGCGQASVQFGTIDSRFADVLQGMILFAVLLADFLLRFKIAKKEEGC